MDGYFQSSYNCKYSCQKKQHWALFGAVGLVCYSHVRWSDQWSTLGMCMWHGTSMIEFRTNFEQTGSVMT